MPIMIDPVGRLSTEHDLHVGDDIIVNAGKRNAVQGRWKYTKMVQQIVKRKSWISHLMPHAALRGITQRPHMVRLRH
jgi:hypothetical protein